MTNTSSLSASATDIETDPATERIRATWVAGDFGRIATSYAPGAAEFIARLQLTRDEFVLDVACAPGISRCQLPALERR